MTSNLDPRSQLFLANVDRIQKSIAVANQQVSSGKKITVASDAPDQIGSLLQLRADLQRNTQIQANLGSAQEEASTADSAIASAITMMDQAMTLGEQGASATTLEPETLQSLAQQVQSIQEQMVACSQTTVNGRYIFSGDQVTSPAFTFNAAYLSTNPVLQLSAAPATYRVEDPAGGSFAAAQNAQQIFNGPAPGNVFTALNNLRLALLNGSTTSIDSAIDLVKQASTHLNSMEAFYGQVENRIQSANDYAATFDTQLKTRISQTEDADITSAALQLTQGSTELQAAMQMQGKMPHSSLFDYLG